MAGRSSPHRTSWSASTSNGSTSRNGRRPIPDAVRSWGSSSPRSASPASWLPCSRCASRPKRSESSIPGAAAAVAELCSRPVRSRPATLHATVWEIDARLVGDLDRTFEHCRAVCTKAGVTFRGEHRRGNFVLDAAAWADDQDLLEPEPHPRFHVAIMNPPYRKLRSDSAERARLSAAGIETSNLYSAFVWLALKLLAGGGELVAITPRSFMNGSYFRPFRQALSQALAFRRIHVYDARDAAFAEDGVLQENVIFHGVRGAGPEAIRITTSLGPTDDGLLERTVEPAELLLPDDPDRVLHVVPDETDAKIAASMRRLPHTLAGLGLGAVNPGMARLAAPYARRARCVRLDGARGRVPGEGAPACRRGAGRCAPDPPRTLRPRVRGLAQGIGNEAERPGRRRPRRRPPATRRLVRPGQPLQCEGRQAPRGRHALRPGAYRRGQCRIRQQAERPAPGKRRASRTLGQGARGVPQRTSAVGAGSSPSPRSHSPTCASC